MSSNDAGAPFGPLPSASAASHIPGSVKSAAGYSSTVAEHIGQARAHLAECGNELGTDEFERLSHEDLLSLTFQLEQSAHQLDALLVRATGALDARSGRFQEDSLAKKAGCRNITELLQQLSQRSASSLGRRLKLARATRAQVGISGSPIPPRFPAVAAALAAGQLPEDSAYQIVQALGRLPHHVNPEHILTAERNIVAQAVGYPLEDTSVTAAPLPQDCDTVRLICDRWCAYLDQDGRQPSEEEALAQRYFTLGREKNGLVPAHGLLTPDTAALIGNLFSSINSPLTSTNRSSDNAEELEAGAAVTGRAAGRSSSVRFVESAPALPSDTAAPSDDRSYGQKVHDALRIVAEIAARAAETPLIGGAPVTVLIQTTEAELVHSLQQDLARAADSPSDAGMVTAGTAGTAGTAWLHGHDGIPSPVSMAMVRHGICAGATQRVFTGPSGEILGIESPTRTFTPHHRRAIAARDGGCIIPGCTVPALWCEVHHVVEWSQGGATSTDNGVLLCWYHHRNIDSNDWHIRMVAGLPEVLAPPWIDPHQIWRKTRPPLRTNPARTARTKSLQRRDRTLLN